jgi:hypothetical protein
MFILFNWILINLSNIVFIEQDGTRIKMYLSYWSEECIMRTYQSEEMAFHIFEQIQNSLKWNNMILSY